MLPSSLLSIYNQYKADTDAVARWLASTAKACGYPADLLQSGSWESSAASGASSAKKAAGGGRMKGKARKAAKAAAKTSGAASGPTPTPTKTGPKYIVPIADYLPLAKYIASFENPVVSVPDSFATTLNRVIALRSGFGERLEKHGAGRGTKADLKHHYFVGVLEGVREALRPRMSSTAPKAADEKAAGVDNLTNMFAGLSVEEPSQAFLDAPDIERPTQPEDDPTVYEAEQRTSLEDLLFAFTIMMNDLARIRATVRWVWQSYAQGAFDIAAAAVATDTALSLARGIIGEVEPLFKDFEQGTWGVHQKFFIACCLRKGYTIDTVFGSTLGSDDNFNYKTYDIADECCFIAHRLLVSFIDVLDPRELPLIKEGFFGYYHPTTNRNTKSGRAKFEEDQVLIMEYLSDLMVIIRLIPSYPVEDEFIRGVRHMDKTHEVSFSLVFAAQTLLDIHHMLRADAFACANNVTQQISALGLTLKSYLDYHKEKKLRISHWPASNDAMLAQVFKQGQEIVRDPVYECKLNYMQRHKVPIEPTMKPNKILQCSPVLAGLHLFRWRGDLYDIGISVANAWGSIQYAMHLYNALQQEKLLGDNRHWRDMDVARSILKESSFFVGDTPRTREDFLKKFALQMGVSVSAFDKPGGAKKKGSKRSDIESRAGPRGIKEGLPVSRVFFEKYVHKKSSDVTWTPENIHDIVSRSEYEAVGELGKGTFMLEQIDEKDQKDVEKKRAAQSAEQQKKDAAAAGKEKRKAKDRLLPGELVQSTVMAVHAEALKMTFPWLMLHISCWELMGAVKDRCHSLMSSIWTPAYIENQTQLPFVIGYIFTAAVGEGPNGAVTTALLQKAADALIELLDCGGGGTALKVLGMMGHPVEFTESHSDSDEE